MKMPGKLLCCLVLVHLRAGGGHGGAGDVVAEPAHEPPQLNSSSKALQWKLPGHFHSVTLLLCTCAPAVATAAPAMP